MRTERLQEIEEGLGMIREFHPKTRAEIAIGYCNELITALEAAQADRDAAITREADEYAKQRDINANLRKQLAEAQKGFLDMKSEADGFVDREFTYIAEINEWKAKLAEAQAENERLREAVEKFRDKFRYEMPELRSEEM